MPCGKMKVLLLAAVFAVLRSAHGFRTLPLPRIPLHDLEKPRNHVYRDGHLPFIMTSVGFDWEAFNVLSPQWLASTFPDAIVDTYLKGMRRQNGQEGQNPHLDWMDEAMAVLADPESGDSSQVPYLQWRITRPQWRRLAPLFEPFPPYLTGDWWQDRCLGNVTTKENFWLATAWRMMVVGKPGSGMFIHPDSFYTSVWQVQLVGHKRWAVCHPDDEEFMPPPGTWDPFSSTVLHEHPSLTRARCGIADVSPGEVLVYPSNYWHATLSLDQPTIGLAGRTVTPLNYRGVYDHLRKECSRPRVDASDSYLGASENLYQDLCTVALPRCLAVWSGTYGAGHQEWADHAQPECRVQPDQRRPCWEATPAGCTAVGCCWAPSAELCADGGCPSCFAPAA